jgi:DNA-binding transcriptional regulator YdaS (Cro superfamily)
MNADGVRRLLRRECEAAGGVTAYARRIGVSRELVRLVLVGRREPAGAILDALDVERAVTYRIRSVKND